MKLMEFVWDCDSGARPSNCKSMRKSSYDEVDVAVRQWFNQKWAERTPVSGPMCAQKAKFFREALGLEVEFSASMGWLTRFK
jgi:hypothetical protein